MPWRARSSCAAWHFRRIRPAFNTWQAKKVEGDGRSKKYEYGAKIVPRQTDPVRPEGGERVGHGVLYRDVRRDPLAVALLGEAHAEREVAAKGSGKLPGMKPTASAAARRPEKPPDPCES